jgi:hypothetical protein
MTAENTADTTNANTIVLIHGLWVTPAAGRSGSSTMRSAAIVCLPPHTQASKPR